jgi:outer membrane protein TolC
MSIILFNLFANEIEVLSITKQKIIELKQKQAKEKEQVNQYEWLSDVTLNASISKNEDEDTSKDYSLSLSQDIFKFGGITSQIEYAKELAKMELIDINTDLKDDLNTLYTTLIDIKLNDISIAQNSLNIENSLIDIKHKLSQYQQGEIGISDLNEAIMSKNEYKDSLKELNLTKLTNINTVKKYTQNSFENITIPDVKLVSKELFIQNALSVAYANSNVKVNNSLYKIKKSDYLPSISVNADIGYNDDNYHDYGIALTIPLNYSYKNNIEQTRLEYLISEQELNDAKQDATLVYDNVVLNIQNYQERITLAIEDIQLYDELLKTTQEEYEAGYKTEDDVQTLKNSMKIRELDIQTYKLNMQKQLVSLYLQLES